MKRYRLPTRKEILVSTIKRLLRKSFSSIIQAVVIAALIGLPVIYYFYFV